MRWLRECAYAAACPVLRVPAVAVVQAVAAAACHQTVCKLLLLQLCAPRGV
jgi:hypothetical protein